MQLTPWQEYIIPAVIAAAVLIIIITATVIIIIITVIIAALTLPLRGKPPILQCL